MAAARDITLRQFVCPTDGTILERGYHTDESGRYECPKCQQRWSPHEIIPSTTDDN